MVQNDKCWFSYLIRAMKAHLLLDNEPAASTYLYQNVKQQKELELELEEAEEANVTKLLVLTLSKRNQHLSDNIS